MATNNDLLNAFRAALIPNTTDFTIRIGKHKWSVHTQAISEKSKFFERVCNSGFKESQTREVELHDDDPADIARMLQFMYLEAYDYNSTHERNRLSPSLFDLVPDIEDVSQTITDEDRDELVLNTDLAMYKIADKYHIPAMIHKITTALISQLTELPCVLSPRQETKSVKEDCDKVFSVLQTPFLGEPSEVFRAKKEQGVLLDYHPVITKYAQVHDTIKSSYIEDPLLRNKMVEILLDFKYRWIGENEDTMKSQSKKALTVGELQTKITEYIHEGGGFAVELAERLETAVKTLWNERKRMKQSHKQDIQRIQDIQEFDSSYLRAIRIDNEQLQEELRRMKALYEESQKRVSSLEKSVDEWKQNATLWKQTAQVPDTKRRKIPAKSRPKRTPIVDDEDLLDIAL